jgi:uncharacterized protein
MAATIIGLCTLDFQLDGVHSLKDKRRIIKSMLTRIRNQFNVSVAEIDYQDVWQSSQIAVVCVSNTSKHVSQTLTAIVHWIEKYYPDAVIVGERHELL